MIKIIQPIITFIIVLNLPYFSLPVSFLTNPMLVPAITAKTAWPKEYKSSSRIPHTILPLPATIAKSAIRTGVEHGEENTPPRIPAINAPIYPFLVLLEIK